MNKFTWQGVAVFAVIIAAAVVMAKMQLPDLAKPLIMGAVSLLALFTQARSGDA